MELFYSPQTIKRAYPYFNYFSRYKKDRLRLKWYSIKEDRFIDLHFELVSNGSSRGPVTFSYRLDNDLKKIMDFDYSNPSSFFDIDLAEINRRGALDIEEMGRISSSLFPVDVREDMALSLIHFYNAVSSGVIPSVEPLVESSEDFSRMVNSIEEGYENELVKKIREEKQKNREREHVRLVLLLKSEYYGEGLLVSAKIGNDKKLYVVKDIRVLLSDIAKRRDMVYGKNFSWDGNTADFDEDSSFYLEILKTHTIGSDYYSSEKERKLEPSGIRKLFEYSQERNLAIDLDGREYHLEKKDPEVTFTIAKEGNKAISVTGKVSVKISRTVSPDPSIKTSYPISDELRKIFIPSDSYSKVFDELRPLIIRSESMKIANRDIPSFISVVLPKMREIGTVMGLDLIPENYVPEEPEFIFRLSLQEDDSVLNSFIYIQCLAQYREGTYSLFRKDKEKGNPIAERKMKGILEKVVLTDAIHQEDGYDIMLSDDDYLIDVMQRLCPALSSYGTLELDHNLMNLKRVDRPVIDIGVTMETNLLELNFNYDRRFLEEVPKILEAIRKKRRYYRLKSGEFLSLTEGSLKELSSIADELDIKERDLVEGKAEVPVFRALYLDQAIKGCAEISYRRNETFKSLVRAIKSYEDSSREVPSDVTAELRGYQKSGYRWLGTMSDENLAGILADDMGLGKTLQILTLLDDYLLTNGSLKAVVVAPASLLINWKDEARKFTPNLKVLPLLGNAMDRKDLLSQRAHIYVTSYAALLRDAGDMREEYDFLILDEAQAIKNATTKQAQAVKSLRAKHRFALTGTPIENNLSELWSIFDFLLPGLLMGRTEFRKKFENPITKGDGASLQRLKKMISPFFLRRMKSDVLKELPEKAIITRKVDLDEDQAKIYKALFLTSKKEYRKLIRDKGLEKSKIEILALLTKLRMVCCDPSLVVDEYAGSSSKLEQLMEIVHESREGGHKILLFSQFTSMLDIIQKRIVSENISFYRIDGSTPKEKRMEYVDAFQKDSTPILLLSLKAGGLGLNLTAADTVIIYDPWWNLTSEEQAIDRAYRIGQKRNIQVYRLIASETIEEKIQELQEKKAMLAHSLLGKEENENDLMLSEADWESLFT